MQSCKLCLYAAVKNASRIINSQFHSTDLLYFDFSPAFDKQYFQPLNLLLSRAIVPVMLLENTAASWRSDKCHCPPPIAKNRPQLFGRWWSAARVTDRRLCSCVSLGSPWVTLVLTRRFWSWVLLVLPSQSGLCLLESCLCLERERGGKCSLLEFINFLREVAS